MTNSIQVSFPVQDWVWLCEFLSQVMHEIDGEELEDTQRILDLLNTAERGEYN